MIEDMPRARPPHLQRQVSRHGKVMWYVRVGKGPRTRISEEYGTESFMAAYRAALEGESVTASKPKSFGTLAWLCDRYRESGAWLRLSAATRRQRDNILKHMIEASGHEPIARVTRKAVLAGRERRKPAAARHFIQTVRGLFKWAVEAELASEDPTQDIKVKRKRTEGFKTWPQEWCDAYERRWPVGTRERVWYDVLFYTGLRRGDAVKVGRPHVRNGQGCIRAEKNGETAYFLVCHELQRSIDAGPTGELTFIAGESGKPLTKESFGNYFRKACRAAGVPGSAHGLRKARATIEAEKGASEAKLNAMFGWQTGSGMAAIYTRAADRERLVFGERKEKTYALTLSSGEGRKPKSRKKSAI